MRKVGKAGGTVITLATAAQSGSHERLDTDGTNVYFLDRSSLMRVPAAGGVKTLVRERVATFALEGSTVYFVPVNDAYVMKLVRGADAPVHVAHDPGASPTGFAFDAENVYWSSPIDEQIRRAGK